DRLYQVYFDLDDNARDLDVRCYCLVRVLIAMRELTPEDTKLRDEIESRLTIEFEQLLGQSADHLEVTRHILRALTTYKPQMALELASRLNTMHRRDHA